jgi:hypothetical protein
MKTGCLLSSCHQYDLPHLRVRSSPACSRYRLSPAVKKPIVQDSLCLRCLKVARKQLRSSRQPAACNCTVMLRPAKQTILGHPDQAHAHGECGPGRSDSCCLIHYLQRLRLVISREAQPDQPALFGSYCRMQLILLYVIAQLVSEWRALHGCVATSGASLCFMSSLSGVQRADFWVNEVDHA